MKVSQPRGRVKNRMAIKKKRFMPPDPAEPEDPSKKKRTKTTPKKKTIKIDTSKKKTKRDLGPILDPIQENKD